MTTAATNNVMPNSAFKAQAAMSINQQILAKFHNMHHSWKRQQISFNKYYEYLEKHAHTFHGEFYRGHLLQTAELYRHHDYGPWFYKIVDMLPVSA